MILALFYACCFLPAFLLFSIQPMTGKEILPLLGGTPQIWLVTLAFFQCTLVGGYGLVYALRKLPAFKAGTVLTISIALGLAWLWCAPQSAPDIHGGLDLYLYLWAQLGIPMVALSALAPMIQRLFHARFPDNPYRLYAISNIGSLLGLLSYPLVIEPAFGLQAQSVYWNIGYGILLILLGTCTLAAWNRNPIQTSITTSPAPAAKNILIWAIIAALTSSMLSGATSLISTDVGSFPLLWVIPLSIYLITFILAFGESFQSHRAKINVYGTSIIIVFLSIVTASNIGFEPPALLFMLVILGTFAISAFLCHATLYDQRPSPEHLSIFYLAIAVGGALGGSFNAFLAPILVASGHEYYYALILSLIFILVPMQKPSDPASQKMMRVIPIIGNVVALLAAILLAYHLDWSKNIDRALALFMFFALLMTSLNKRTVLITLMGCALLMSVRSEADTLYQKRNFFGIWRVKEIKSHDYRALRHGTTEHGGEPNDPAWQGKPVAYYGEAGPAGQIMTLYPAGHIATIGLGSGQMTYYRNNQRNMDVYEIDPDAPAIAKDYFSYLNTYGYDAMIIGDARLEMAKRDTMYDVIVLDAFTSDAIPAHLLTVEAMQMYLSHLKPGGMLLFHISNRFFDLRGPLAANAKELGLSLAVMNYKPGPDRPYDKTSRWVALAPDAARITPLLTQDWTVPEAKGQAWTDDYTSLMSAFMNKI